MLTPLHVKVLRLMLAAGAILFLAAAGGGCGDGAEPADRPATGGTASPAATGGAVGGRGTAGAPGGHGGIPVAGGSDGGGQGGHLPGTGGVGPGGAGGGAPVRAFPLCFQSATDPVPWRACPGRISKGGYPCAICDSLPFTGFECVLTDDPLNQAAGGNPVLCVQASCSECS